MSNTKADVAKKVAALDTQLKGKLFLGGSKPSAEDVKAFNDLLGAGNGNVFRWVKNVASFTKAERDAWTTPIKAAKPEPMKLPATAAVPAPAAKSPAAKPAQGKPVSPAAKPAAAPAKPAADDDEVDLFGEETEEEAAALAAKKAADAEKHKPKKTVIAKSSILIDIKPWEDTTDLEALVLKLRAVERDGLLWGAHKLVPVAYGLKKLQVLITIEDDKISSDDLEDIITGFTDDVQSMDIAAWNKV